jgi:hypothetical protein
MKSRLAGEAAEASTAELAKGCGDLGHKGCPC